MKPEDQKLYSEKFKEINEAYKVLSNEDSRYKYDQFLGISSEESLREDSLYAKILREKEENEAKRYRGEPEKTLDLAGELRKLEQIKL